MASSRLPVAKAHTCPVWNETHSHTQCCCFLLFTKLHSSSISKLSFSGGGTSVVARGGSASTPFLAPGTPCADSPVSCGRYRPGTHWVVVSSPATPAESRLLSPRSGDKSDPEGEGPPTLVAVAPRRARTVHSIATNGQTPTTMRTKHA